MRRMKASGIPWLGCVPQDWGICKCKYVFSSYKIIVGEAHSSYERLALTMHGVIKRAKMDSQGLQPEDFESYQILKENDFVFKLIDLQNVSTSRVGLSQYTGIVSPAYIVLHAKAIDNRFAYYYFLMMWLSQIFNQLGNGGVRNSLTAQALLNQPILLPSPCEQWCIAKWLDGATARIDSLKEKIAHEIELLDGYKHSFISEAVMGRIPQCTRTFKPSGIPWVREVPKEWKVAKVGYLLDEINRRSKDGQEEPLSMSQKLGIVPSREIEVANPASSYVGAKIVSPGDLVLNKLKAHLGVFAISKFEGLVSPDYAVYRAKEDVSVEYLNYVFHTPPCISEFKRRITGVAVGFNRLYTSDLFKVSVPFPPLREQREIAAMIKKRCEAIDSVIAKRKAEDERLDALKRSLIAEAVTGKKAIYQGGGR